MTIYDDFFFDQAFEVMEREADRPQDSEQASLFETEPPVVILCPFCECEFCRCAPLSGERVRGFAYGAAVRAARFERDPEEDEELRDEASRPGYNGYLRGGLPLDY